MNEAIKAYNKVMRQWRKWYNAATPQQVAKQSRKWADRIRNAEQAIIATR